MEVRGKWKKSLVKVIFKMLKGKAASKIETSIFSNNPCIQRGQVWNFFSIFVNLNFFLLGFRFSDGANFHSKMAVSIIFPDIFVYVPIPFFSNLTFDHMTNVPCFWVDLYLQKEDFHKRRPKTYPSSFVAGLPTFRFSC